MKEIALPEIEMTVDEVMRRWHSTIRVFMDFNMHCVGCPIATFHSVEEACREHGIDLVTFLRRLQAAVRTSQISGLAVAEYDSPSARANSL
jgi:hybrid cluster-associated redox disulfide protein